MSKGDALLGAVIGLGLGEGVNALNDYASGGIGGKVPKGGYGTPDLSAGSAAFDQDLAAANVRDKVVNVAAKLPQHILNSDEQPGNLLPPIDQSGQPLDNHPEVENGGDSVYQSQWSGGDEMAQQHPDKYDTILGDSLQQSRRARVFRAASDAAHINEVLGQRQISRQQASQLIRDYHQKYPDINIPIQPYTSQQAQELRGRALLAQKQDEAEQMGLGRDAYTTDPQTGLPVQNPVYFHKLALDQQAKQNQRIIDNEKEQARLKEAAQTAREEAQRKHERAMNADQALATTLKTLPKPPTKIDQLSATPQQVAKYEADKAAYDDPLTGHDAVLKAAREQWVLDKGYTPVAKPQATVPWSNPHTATPEETAAQAGIGFASHPEDGYKMFNPGDKFLDATGQQHVVPTLPKFNTPEDARKNLKLGDKFIDSEGSVRKVTKVATPAAAPDITPAKPPQSELVLERPSRQSFEEMLSKLDSGSKSMLAEVLSGQVPETKVAEKKRTRKIK